MQITKYNSIYRENCIQIFKSNLPKYFAIEELSQFEGFLDRVVDHYYVAQINGRTVGCGGFFFDKKG
jgi:hypothetical protein